MQYVKSLHPFKGTPLKVKEVLWRQTQRSGEHITIETPLSTQGELPKISSKHTILSQSTTSNISLAFEDHTSGSQDFEHQASILDVPISSDIVHDTVLTTQDLYPDVEGLHVGADPDDNTTNLRVLEVLTSALETTTSKSIIHNV